MDAITKDSPEWLAALTLVPEKWQANCPEHRGNNHCSKIPDITPDLLYAIRRAIEARDCMWTLSYSAKRGCIFSVHLSERVFTGRGETESDAIIHAAASLKEAK